jgi:hypothetical protein
MGPQPGRECSDQQSSVGPTSVPAGAIVENEQRLACLIAALLPIAQLAIGDLQQAGLKGRTACAPVHAFGALTRRPPERL